MESHVQMPAPDPTWYLSRQDTFKFIHLIKGGANTLSISLAPFPL